MLRGKTVVQLATDLAAGTITERAIREELGEGVLNSVLAIGGGFVAGMLANTILNEIDHHTGIVSDLGGVVDDILDIF